jgi:hypothetical protein
VNTRRMAAASASSTANMLTTMAARRQAAQAQRSRIPHVPAGGRERSWPNRLQHAVSGRAARWPGLRAVPQLESRMPDKPGYRAFRRACFDPRRSALAGAVYA